MAPIHDAARGGQDALERLMNALPGFKGYREEELRRDTDRILRDHLAARLDLFKKGDVLDARLNDRESVLRGLQ